METINAIELADENVFPSEEVLENVLGDSIGTYLDLLQLYERNGLNHEWRYYHDGKAWLCKVQKRKQTMAWMSAWHGYMQVTIYIPVSQLDKLLELEINDEEKQRITEVKRVGKSIPCIFYVREQDVLDPIEKVIKFKMSNK